MIKHDELAKEMSPYAPIRLRGEPWWKYAEAMGTMGYVKRDGLFAGDVPGMIMQESINPEMENIVTVAKRDPEVAAVIPMYYTKLLARRHWIPLVAQYTLCGKQIFDLGDNLVEMLANTDVGECTLEDWKPPYDAFFIRFGKQDRISLPFEGVVREYVDGAFVAVTPWDVGSSDRRIKIGFTMVKDDGSGVIMPGYFMDFTPNEQRMVVREAAVHSIQRRIKLLEDEPNETDFLLMVTQSRIAELRETSDLVKSLLDLVVNAMFYIESTHTEGKTAPGRDAPPSYVAEWENATPERRIKLRKKILADGYTIVRMSGHELGNTSASGSGDSKRTHWRRGHWRNQPHGEKLSLVKRVWIRPVLVNADNETEPVVGHIYIAEDSARTH